MTLFGKDSKIEINMRDGDPNGIRVADMPMYPTLAIAFRKNQLGRLRKDYSWIDGRTGVYFLIGPDKNTDHMLTAYIGKGENVGKRLCGHLSGTRRSNRNWVDTIVVARNDDKLTDAHGRYAESQLIRDASSSPRWQLINNNKPKENAGNLSASDKPGMDQFVLQAKTLIGCLGWDLFRNPHDPSQQTTSDGHVSQSPDTPKFVLEGGGYSAYMIIDTSGNFVVLKGSRARIRETNTLQPGLRKIRRSLLEDGVLQDSNGAFVFTNNYISSSVSTAAAIVKGASETGRKAWKVEGEKTTYAEWEASQGE